MTNGYDFTEYEIRKKLEELGYSNIPAEKLRQFQSGRLSLTFKIVTVKKFF